MTNAVPFLQKDAHVVRQILKTYKRKQKFSP